MQHVINLSFTIEDGDIIKRIEEIAVDKAIKDVKEKAIAELGLDRRWNREALVTEISKEIGDKIIEDGIADTAASKIVQSVVSRKAFIKAVSDGVLQDMLQKAVAETDEGGDE